MAKLEGVKTLDMVGGEITKVEYNGAIYEKVDGKAVPNDIVEVIDGFGHLDSGDFGKVVRGSEWDATVYDGLGYRGIYRGTPDAVNVFRKVSESKPKTVKRKARVGERILITETVGSGGEYSIGDIRTVKRVLDEGVFVEEQGIGLFHSEYEVIAPTFSEGDRVKVLAYGEDRDIKVGEIGTVEDIHDDEDDPYTIGVESDEGNYDYFRPEDIELVEEEPYKPAEGDIVVITANTNRSRNAVGDIGKVGLYIGGDGVNVNVPGKTEGNGNLTLIEEMRPATDEEKAQYEKAERFAKLGRKPGEFKKGDIVRLNQYTGADSEGTVVEIASDGAHMYIGVDGDEYRGDTKWFDLIAPVESRVDLDD